MARKAEQTDRNASPAKKKDVKRDAARLRRDAERRALRRIDPDHDDMPEITHRPLRGYAS